MKTLKVLSLLLLGLNTSLLAKESAIQPEETTRVLQTTIQMNTLPNKININTATATELQDKLVGIGEKKAQAIVDYRTQNGNFKNIEQLSEVSGIGQAILEKNRNNIVVE